MVDREQEYIWVYGRKDWGRTKGRRDTGDLESQVVVEEELHNVLDELITRTKIDKGLTVKELSRRSL